MSYGVLVVCAEIDRFLHNALFSNELKVAFQDCGWEMRTIDYMAQNKKLFEALKDPECRFFVTFNGFGTEVCCLSTSPGGLNSAYQAFAKPVFDLMHDCPAHESMAHQLGATFSRRTLFSTDYQYAGIASEMGVQDVTFCSSITFPAALSGLVARSERDIDVLLAIGTSSPEFAQKRIDISTIRGRLYRAVFDEVTACAVADWQLDPIVELKRVLRGLDIALDYNLPDHRFLLTLALDYIKFARRRDLLAALTDLPITLVPDQAGAYSDKFRVEGARSATELLALMARSRIVVCPTTHNTGYHERPLSAFTASAAVVSAPNKVLSANFSDRKEIIFASGPNTLREILGGLISNPTESEKIAERGHKRAMALYQPRHLVSAILNRLNIDASRAAG